MKTKMFHDLEARGKNWYKELPSVLWILRTNINRATRDTPFNLVHREDNVLPPKIYLQSARVAYFDSEHQVEARELDSILLEERCDILAQGLIGLIEYSYYQGIPSLPKSHL
jgi:hypothetical protein